MCYVNRRHTDCGNVYEFLRPCPPLTLQKVCQCLGNTTTFSDAILHIVVFQRWPNLRPSFFWDVTLRSFLLCYRRFGTKYRPTFKDQAVILLGLLDPWPLTMRQAVTKRRRVTSQKSEGLNYTASESWNINNFPSLCLFYLFIYLRFI
jgi:hypothetical protein